MNDFSDILIVAFFTFYGYIGQFQKISIHHNGQLFGILRARGGGGSLNWNSEGKGRFFEMEF